MARKVNTIDTRRPRTIVVGAGITEYQYLKHLIEYWFLLHFENTNRFFGTSSKVIEALIRYLSNFEKKEHYLKQEKWMHRLIEGGNIEKAYVRAKSFEHRGESYSDMWKAIDKFSKTE